MKPIITYIRLQILSCLLLGSLLHAYEPKIKLSGRKDVVLASKSRKVVLETGQQFLAGKDDDFGAEIVNIKNPFSFDDEDSVEVVSSDDAVEIKKPELAVTYSEAMVLEVAAESFAKQVRGSLVRGDKSFLQLAGGKLLKPGASFPVRLPQAGNQTFTITVEEITSSGYTLRIGEARKTLTYDDQGQSGPGSVQLSNP